MTDGATVTSVILKQFKHDCKGQPTVYLCIFISKLLSHSTLPS